MSALQTVSVVIPAYNAAEQIAETLRAILAQSGTSKPEIIVVDNASTDATAEVVRRFDVTLLHESNRGPAAARNRGLFAATGDIIVHLDADTVPSRRWLKEILQPFSDPAVIVTGGNTLSYPPQTPAERYVVGSGLYDTERAITRRSFPFVPSLNLAVRRRAAIHIGGWSEDMPTGEDVDFSHRLLREYKDCIAYAPRAILYHHTRATPTALQQQAWTYGEGAAHLYLRYPDALSWNVTQYVNLARIFGKRLCFMILLSLGKMLDLVAEDKAEFAVFQVLWDWSFWRGFFSMIRSGGRRTA